MRNRCKLSRSTDSEDGGQRRRVEQLGRGDTLEVENDVGEQVEEHDMGRG